MTCLSYEYEGRISELEEYLESRLLTYVTTTNTANPPAGQVAISTPWFPSVFGWNKWPVQATSALYRDGESQFSDVEDMPGVVVIGWRVHALSLVAKQQGNSLEVIKEGRQEARDITRRVADNFRYAFLTDYDLEKRTANGLSIGREESGDKDRHGAYYEEVTSTGMRIIWVHQMECRITL